MLCTVFKVKKIFFLLFYASNMQSLLKVTGTYLCIDIFFQY